MKAISERQPWAYLICANIKPIENRTWKTNFRGRVLIHASASPWGNLKVDSCFTHILTYGQYKHLKCSNFKTYFLDLDSFSFGAIIGSVEIVDCVINHPSIWAEKDCYNWVLANPILFDNPIPAKGKLSFWESEVEICHICGKPTTKDYECERCHEFYCEDCQAVYNQFTQIDYNCCKECAK